MKPATSLRNRTPSSTGFASGFEATAGAAAVVHMVHGQLVVTVTGTPDDGASTLPLSSTALLFSVTVPTTLGVQEYVQEVVPVAGCHVEPPSTDTSTPATTPPVSLAVPVTVTGTPS